MKILPQVVHSAMAVSIAWFIFFPLLAARAANLPLPAVIEAGFDLWSKGSGVDTVLGSWQKGGLMEASNKTAGQAGYLRSLSHGVGNYKSHEIIQSKEVSHLSQVIYLSINFERGVVYGRFLVYQTDKDWVVQNMDFSERPEAIMPWLALEGDKTTQ